MIDASEVAILLLAAGRSTRFEGGRKLEACYQDAPLAAHAALAFAGIGARLHLAVCADASGPTATLLAAMGYEIAVNPAPERGLSSSLAIGIAHIRDTDAQAVLIGLADMPGVTTCHLERLLAQFSSATEMVASAAAGVASPPALIGRGLFPQLLALQGDRGARDLLASAVVVEASADELRDVDRVTDLRG